MMALGALGFLQPWVLVGLAALPAIWWLLRLTPPNPQRIVFPPTRLLKDLASSEETPAHSPWWLTLLRMLLAALIIFALAQPVLNPDRQTISGKGPLLLVVDNGWASGAHWDQRRQAIADAIDRARRSNKTVILAPTAPGTPISGPDDADKAQDYAASLKPEPVAPNRRAVAKALEKSFGDKTGYNVVWLTDGLDFGNAQAFADTLAKLAGKTGHLTIYQPGQLEAPLLLSQIPGDALHLKAKVTSGAEGPRSGEVKAMTGRGDVLGEAPFTIPAGARSAQVSFNLPLEIRNQIARLAIDGEPSAGAVQLFDGRSQWHRVGIVSGESREAAEPLLSPLYYVRKALSPYADIVAPQSGNIATSVRDLIDRHVSAIVLADIGKLVPSTQKDLRDWLAGGGMLIRFAGPRMEQGTDKLLPVILRRGGRSLGGSMSWSTPQPLAPFGQKSPFRGLTIPKDVTVNRQVLADPAGLENADVWARLADGTPLVTAAHQGKGWIVLFHVTANSDWSNLPLSGLFVEMLRRLVDLAPTDVVPASQSQSGTSQSAEQSAAPANITAASLPPVQSLDGFGQLVPPPPQAIALSAKDVNSATPSLQHPPGIYGHGRAARALNIGRPDMTLTPLSVTGIAATTEQLGYNRRHPMALAKWLYLAALTLFVIDILAMLILSGGLRMRTRSRPGRTRSAVVLLPLALIGAGLIAAPWTQAKAEGTSTITPAEQYGLKYSLRTHLAYVITGNKQLDERSREGLEGLTRVLTARTALEPGAPVGVNVAKNVLAFFPVLYWPVLKNAKPLSDATVAKVDAYMKQGGLIIFDTRDQDTDARGEFHGDTALERLIGRLDIPPLEPVPPNHVLTKSFYLLHHFPGRWAGGTLWVEATPSSNATSQNRSHTDNVSSIIITSNDFASAWALDNQDRPLYPVVPGGQRQREMAFRAGVNIVMYALTGNYKADQVHVPALLERLGQ